MANLAQQLAEKAAAIRFESLSKETVHEVKRRILDSIGCALGAWNSRPAKVTRQVALGVPAPDGASILGHKARTTPDLATFTNGALVRYLDFNDTYLSLEPAHPSDNIPAALAVGQVTKSSPKDIIAAIALAYEVQCRFCDAASLRKHGWDHVYYGALSSALAAAKLWKLSPEQMVHALGIAGVCNFATRQTRTGQLSDWKACAFSNAGRNGVFAANLARLGMSGPNEIFEGPKGLFKMVTGPCEPKWAAHADDWMIRKTYIKFWPAEYHSQSAIDACLQLRPQIAEQGKGPIGDMSKVQSIVVESFEAAVSIIGSEPEKWRPTSRETADHSMGFCMACALLDGDVTRASFSDAKIRDPQVLALLDKIKIVETAECNAGYPDGIPNNIVVSLADGRKLAKKVTYPRGHAGNPMSDEEVVRKFKTLAAGVVSEATASRIIEQCMGFETLPDIAALLEFETSGA